MAHSRMSGFGGHILRASILIFGALQVLLMSNPSQKQLVHKKNNQGQLISRRPLIQQIQGSLSLMVNYIVHITFNVKGNW